MGRQRTTHTYLPKYVKPNHGSLYYAPPKQKPVRICKIGDDQALYKFMLTLTEPAGPVTTMGDLFDRYEREIVPTLSPTTQKDYRWLLKFLREYYSHMRPDEVTTKDCGLLLQSQKHGKAVRVRLLAVLSSVFSQAVGFWFVCERNPCRDVKRPPTGKRDRYINDEEYEIIKARMPLRHQIAMDLALLTGQRQGDLLSLKWDQVGPEGIYFEPSKVRKKTKKKILVLYSPMLKETLARAKMLIPHLPREYVLRTAKGKRYSAGGFRSIWGRVMRKAMKDGVIETRFTFHDIRAKTVSDEDDLGKANLRAGHTSMAMTKGVYDRGVRKVTPLK